MSLSTALPNPRAEEEFDDYVIRAGGNPIGSEVVAEWGFAGMGKGKLTLVRSVLGRWADPGGDEVATAAANAVLVSYVVGSQTRHKPLWASQMAEAVREAMGVGWSPAEAARAACGLGLAKAATTLRSRDDLRDFIAQGYGVFHDRAYLGYDDRGERPLVLSLGADGFRWESAPDRGIAVSGTLGWPRRK